MSIDSAIARDKAKFISVEVFIQALQFFGNISNRKAISQFGQLVARGLRPIALGHDYENAPAITGGELLPSIYAARMADSVMDETTRIEITHNPNFDHLTDATFEVAPYLSPRPRLGDLIVLAQDAFSLFKKLEVAQPWPWDYRGFYPEYAEELTFEEFCKAWIYSYSDGKPQTKEAIENINDFSVINPTENEIIGVMSEALLWVKTTYWNENVTSSKRSPSKVIIDSIIERYPKLGRKGALFIDGITRPEQFKKGGIIPKK